MVEQGSIEWHQLRLGKATASRFKDVLAKIKTGEAAGRRNYRAELVVQRLTKTVTDSYTNAAMLWGTEHEYEARMAYIEKSLNLVETVDFVDHSALLAGCSPDGLIDDDGGLEIKCPYQTAVHIDTLRNGMPSEHMAQIQGCMWITGRKWWDFVSYDPRLRDAGLGMYVERIARNEQYIENLAKEVAGFLVEVEYEVNSLLELKAKAA